MVKIHYLDIIKQQKEVFTLRNAGP